ncbi:ATP-binding protein [Magnetovibrio sp.]|uniref:ATP-binding protein n=1 Tax=Magnetovibrio sp. TaxID=2024836 RepID=UPI002F952B62
MKPWPQTIMGRTLTVLLMGIVLTTMISFAYQFMERRALLSTIGGWHGAERISDIIAKVELAQPIDRATLARSFETPGFRAAWSLETSLAPMDLDWQGRQVKRALEEFLGDISPDSLRIEITSYRNASTAVPHTRMKEWRKRLEMQRHAESMGRMMQGHGAPFMVPEALLERDLDRSVLLISYRLNDGSWLTFLTPPAPVNPVWNTRFFLPSVLSLLIVIAISVWAVRRSTKPLNRFALAAARLGMDVNAPPMAEDGPREVRRAATAFNRMQRRLQAFVKDRTHMLAAISHDLRTPITRLRLRAEFIDDDEQREKMLSDLEEMEAMISATLQFARDDVTGEPSKILDLAVLVSELCADARRAGDDVAYNGPETLAFTGREVSLKRMTSNLIGNAVRYGDRARVRLEETPDEVRLIVDDDGPGIPSDMVERVFDPFVRVERSRSRETGGTGLGLTAVKSIVQAHGGKVELINPDRGGLEVRVVLPRAET